MAFGDLLPLITGSGGCIVALAFGLYLILSGRLYTREAFKAESAKSEKLEEANAALRRVLDEERDQKQQLLSSASIVSQLVAAVISLSGRQLPPAAAAAVAAVEGGEPVAP